MKVTRCALAALLASMALAYPALASSGSRDAGTLRVQMQVEAGFDAYVKSEAWVPVRVRLVNEGDALEGEVALSRSSRAVGERYAQLVSLPANGRRVVTLYVPGDVSNFNVTLRAGDRVVAAAEAPVRRLDRLERLALIVSDAPDAFNFIGSVPSPVSERTALALLSPDQIPDRSAALDSADVLIFNTDTAALSRAQREAVRAWVMAGGHVILNGGVNAALNQRGFADIAPARASVSLVEAELRHIAAFAGGASVQADQPVLAAPLESVLASAHILASSPATPLIVRQPLGRGLVDQLAFDASLEPLRSWSGRSALFALLMGGRAGWPLSIGLTENTLGAAQQAAAALPRGLSPSPLFVALLFVAYFLIIGPANWAVLRARGKLEWAWLTMPALTIIFTALASLTGFRLEGNRPIVHRLSTQLGSVNLGDARALEIYAGLSPREESVTLAFTRTLAYPITEPGAPDARVPFTVTLTRGDPERLSNWLISNQKLELLYASGATVQPMVSGRLEFVLDHPTNTATLKGTLTNQGSDLLLDCSLLVGHDSVALGDLPPQVSVQAQVTLTADHPQPWFDLRAINAAVASANLPLGQRTLDIGTATTGWVEVPAADPAASARRVARMELARSIFGNMPVGVGAFLACWRDEVPQGGYVDYADFVDRSLHLWRVPVQRFGVARSALPPVAYAWSLLSSSGFWLEDQGMQLNRGDHVFLLEPWFEVRVPSSASAEVRVDVTWLDALSVESDTLTVQAFNWRSGAFETLDVSALLLTESAAMPLSTDHIREDGRIVLRLRSNESGQAVLHKIVPSVYAR